MLSKKNCYRWVSILLATILVFSAETVHADFSLPDYSISLFPNDSDLEYQYYLEQNQAIEAWDIIKESPEVVVAVIDSGVDIEHPDLISNIWINLDEVPKDGIDNDGNGYVDDVNGWDFVLKSPDPRPKFAGEYNELGINHGSIVAGVIGAVGNNSFGLSGISWKVKIMPLKVMDGIGSGTTSNVYWAIKYAIANGADVINLSMVGIVYDPSLHQVIKEAYEAGIVIVAAAGNESSSATGEDVSINLDASPHYPICYTGDNGENYVLGVGSVNYLDVKSSFSNYGSSCVDIVAPGESFYGTKFFSPVISGFSQYIGGYYSGTSLSAPQVTGAAALVKALRPELVNSEIYNLITANADPIDDKNNNYQGMLGSGRLNILKTLTAAGGVVITGGDLVIAPASGHSPLIQIVNRAGAKRFEFFAYNEGFKGGLSITTADIDGDGEKEIITGAGVSGGPHIRVFNADGQIISQFFAYEYNFTGGVNVTAGDVDGDGAVEIIVSPQTNSQSKIRIFDSLGNLEKEFLAFDSNFYGGANLALSDINIDGIKEIVVGAGPGLTPQIKIFNYNGMLLKEFLAYSADFTGGVKVSSADVFSDLRTEIITSPQTNDKCQIRIFSPSGDIQQQWLSWENESKGCNITTGDIDFNGQAEIIASQIAGAEVKIYNSSRQLENNFTAFEDDFEGGVNVFVK